MTNPLRTIGFNPDVPEGWSRPWLMMWLVSSTVLIVLAFKLKFWPDWLIATIPLFFVPEIISLWRRQDRLPPLTHTIRHFLPDWLAFPLIYFLFGSIAARALGFAYPRNLHVGGLFGLLGWLTDHFTVTYASRDPYPFSKPGEVTAESAKPRAT